MCGIAGLFYPQPMSSGLDEAKQVVKSMTRTLSHRGPDADGLWVDPTGRCVLGHRRLSVIDPSDAGRQPMAHPDFPWLITFNGEIYNFQELKKLLEKKGCRFRGRTDTEVLLTSIAYWGTACLEKLDGMFAFAAFNTESGELLLARDAFGEKPLYYMELPEGGLAFASELQALEMVPGFDGEVSADAIAEVLMFQYIGAPRSIYRSIKKLPPGHWLSVTGRKSQRVGRYFQFLPDGRGFDGNRTKTDLADELEDILCRSIRNRLISDVPLGAFLSGGVDSSTVCALARKRLDVPINTFSIGFEDSVESEHGAAREFARHLDLTHHDKILKPDVSGFLLRIGELLDEPNADSSCLPTYLLSQLARERVTVAVSGDGGDEMFAGYKRYLQTIFDEQAAADGHTGDWRPGQAYYSHWILVFEEHGIEQLMGRVPNNLLSHLNQLRDEINQLSPSLLCRLRQSDVNNYLPGAVLAKVDRMSMQHSLEVRTPFLNIELARFAERVPQHMLCNATNGKLLLKEIAYRYLPRHLIDVPKKGFGLPMTEWGRKKLFDVAGEILGPDSRLRKCFGESAIDGFLHRLPSTYQLWAVAILESWFRHHPARLPDLTIEEPRTGISVARAPEHGDRDLILWGLGSQTFLVLEDANQLPPWKKQTPEGRRDTEDLLGMLFAARPAGAMHPRADPPFEFGDELISIPGWRSKKQRSEQLRPELSGATLLFHETNCSQSVDGDELDRFSRMGVRELVFYHQDKWTIFRIRINGASGFERISRLLILHRLAVKSWTRDQCEKAPPHGFVGPALKKIADIDISNWVPVPLLMCYEDGKQLPPIPASFEDICRLGGGRYGLFSGHCHFSPRDSSAIKPRYRLIPVNRVTERLLDFVPDFPVRGRGRDLFLAAFSSWVQQQRRDSPSLHLKPGDSIALVTHALYPGGAERQWCYLARGLRDLGYEVRFIVTESLEGPRAHYLPLLRSYGIEPIPLWEVDPAEALASIPDECPPHLFMSWEQGGLGMRFLQLAHLLQQLRCSVVISQLDETNILGGAAGLVANVPRVVLSFRNYNPSRISYISNDIFQPAYKAICAAPRVILSGNARTPNVDYAQWLGVPETRVHWVPNVIDTDLIQRPPEDDVRKLRSELGVTPDSPVLLGVFRISEEKRPLMFVDVCARIATKVPGLRVFVAGIGKMRGEMQEKIYQYDLQDNIILLGKRNDVPTLMALSSVLLLTSGLEGMPNVLLEAQAIGLPVVATRVGGVADCVRDNETGFVIGMSDIDELVAACVKLLLDPEKASAFGKAGMAYMREQFSVNKLAENYLSLLKESE